MEPLKNARQEQFCLEYIIDLNGTQAAIRAGYAKKTANTTASKLLAKDNIAKRVDFLKNRRQVKCNIDAQWVLNRLNEIDSLDVIDILDDEANILPIRQWPKAWRISISGLDVQKLMAAGKDPDAMQSAVLKIKWPDKTRNLELIGRHVSVRAWEKEQVDNSDALANALKDLAAGLPE